MSSLAEDVLRKTAEYRSSSVVLKSNVIRILLDKASCSIMITSAHELEVKAVTLGHLCRNQKFIEITGQWPCEIYHVR